MFMRWIRRPIASITVVEVGIDWTGSSIANAVPDISGPYQHEKIHEQKVNRTDNRGDWSKRENLGDGKGE
jgi:hypothetical protein